MKAFLPYTVKRPSGMAGVSLLTLFHNLSILYFRALYTLGLIF
jgi:hypothetical protein